MAPDTDYSHRSAVQKLGVRPGDRVEVVGDVGAGLRRDVKDVAGRGLVRSGELDGAIVLVDDAALAAEVDTERARTQLDEARAELERVDRGESSADRWQLEQRIKHAENQLSVGGRD